MAVPVIFVDIITIGVLSSLLEVSNMINNRGYTHQSNFFLLKDPPNKETYSLAEFPK